MTQPSAKKINTQDKINFMRQNEQNIVAGDVNIPDSGPGIAVPRANGETIVFNIDNLLAFMNSNAN